MQQPRKGVLLETCTHILYSTKLPSRLSFSHCKYIPQEAYLIIWRLYLVNISKSFMKAAFFDLNCNNTLAELIMSGPDKTLLLRHGLPKFALQWNPILTLPGLLGCLTSWCGKCNNSTSFAFFFLSSITLF